MIKLKSNNIFNDALFVNYFQSEKRTLFTCK